MEFPRCYAYFPKLCHVTLIFPFSNGENSPAISCITLSLPPLIQTDRYCPLYNAIYVSGPHTAP